MLAVDLGDGRVDLRADEGLEVFDVVQVDLAGGHEGADPADEFELEPALVVAGDAGLDDAALVDRVPGRAGDRALAREEHQALALVDVIDDEVHDRAEARGTLELLQRDNALELAGVAGDIDEDVLAADGGDAAAADLVVDGLFFLAFFA